MDNLRILAEQNLCLVDVDAVKRRINSLSHVQPSVLQEALENVIIAVHTTTSQHVELTLMWQKLASQLLLSQMTKDLYQQRQNEIAQLRPQRHMEDKFDHLVKEITENSMRNILNSSIPADSTPINALVASLLQNPFSMVDSVYIAVCDNNGQCLCHRFVELYMKLLSQPERQQQHLQFFECVVAFINIIDHCRNYDPSLFEVKIQDMMLGMLGYELLEFRDRRTDIVHSTIDRKSKFHEKLKMYLSAMGDDYLATLLGFYSGSLCFSKLRRDTYNDVMEAFGCTALKMLRNACELLFYDTRTILDDDQVSGFTQYFSTSLKLKAMSSPFNMIRRLKMVKDNAAEYIRAVTDTLLMPRNLVDNALNNSQGAQQCLTVVQEVLTQLCENPSNRLGMYLPQGEYTVKGQMKKGPGQMQGSGYVLKVPNVPQDMKRKALVPNNFPIISKFHGAYAMDGGYMKNPCQSVLSGHHATLVNILKNSDSRVKSSCRTYEEVQDICNTIRIMNEAESIPQGNFLGFVNSLCNLKADHILSDLIQSKGGEDYRASGFLGDFVEFIMSNRILEGSLFHKPEFTGKDNTKGWEEQALLTYHQSLQNYVNSLKEKFYVPLKKSLHLWYNESIHLNDWYKLVGVFEQNENEDLKTVRSILIRLHKLLNNNKVEDIPFPPKKEAPAPLFENMQLKMMMLPLQVPSVICGRVSPLNLIMLETILSQPEELSSVYEQGRIDVIGKFFFFLQRYTSLMLKGFFDKVSGDGELLEKVLGKAPKTVHDRVKMTQKIDEIHKQLNGEVHQEFLKKSNMMKILHCYDTLYDIVIKNDSSVASILANMENLKHVTSNMEDVFVSVVCKMADIE